MRSCRSSGGSTRPERRSLVRLRNERPRRAAFLGPISDQLGFSGTQAGVLVGATAMVLAGARLPEVAGEQPAGSTPEGASSGERA